MLPAGSETLLGTTLTASAVSVFIINTLKNAKWFPLLKPEWEKAQRVWALMFAALAAAGIDVKFLHGTLTISGLTLTGILAALWMWLKSFAIQEWIYQSTKVQQKADQPPANSSAVGVGVVGTGAGVAAPAPKPVPATKRAALAFRRMLVRRELAFAVVLFGICLMWIGCAARVKTVTNLPAGVSNSEVVNWDAAIANLQKIATATSGARQAVISLNKSGVFPDGPAYATTLADIGKIDQVELTASNFLQGVPDNWGQSTQTQVSGYVSAIEAAVTDLTKNGTVGIKDSKSQSTVTAYAQQIGALVNFILSLVTPAPAATTPSALMLRVAGIFSAVRVQRGDEYRASASLYRESSNTPASSVLDGTVCRILGSGTCAAFAS